MKNYYSKTILSIIALLVFTTVGFAQTRAFTFQGNLTDISVNANGPYDFTFKLYDLLANRTQIGTDIVLDDVEVASGIFTINLDFGAAAFSSGGLRFIDLQVSPGASAGAYTQLAPRRPITSAHFR